MKELNKKEQDLKLKESFNKRTNEILLLFNVSGSVCQYVAYRYHIDIKNKRIECSGCKIGKWLTDH